MIKTTQPRKSWSQHFTKMAAKRRLNSLYGRWAADMNRRYGKYGVHVSGAE